MHQRHKSSEKLENFMETYIALLRGINVGGKNRLLMKELIELLEENGFNNVKTYIQSGNVVFRNDHSSSIDISETISALIDQQFGFMPDIIVLEKAAFDLALNNNPYTANEGKTSHFYFCKTAVNINTEKIEKYHSESEEYQLIDNVFYLYAPNGIGTSKLVANIEVCLGTQTTGRNLNTVNKLKQLVDSH